MKRTAIHYCTKVDTIPNWLQNKGDRDFDAGVLGLFLLETKGSIWGRWEGYMLKEAQVALFGRYLGKGKIVINGYSETVDHIRKVCFGLDNVDAIMSFEECTLDAKGTLELFSHLIKYGQAWTLQGSYGRIAASLIKQGVIDSLGNINPKHLEEVQA